jgi:hypothetical protein
MKVRHSTYFTGDIVARDGYRVYCAYCGQGFFNAGNLAAHLNVKPLWQRALAKRIANKRAFERSRRLRFKESA